MPSQFFGLYIAGSGLRAANAALNTTSNNIANTQTVGYSRQAVTQQASAALRTFTSYGCAGAGVDTLAIERVRDHFYDVKYWNNSASLGKYDTQQYYMSTIEEYFDDVGTSGFGTLFDGLSAALQSLTGHRASDATAKADFVSNVKSLTDYFNNMYGNLQEMQYDLNQEIKQTVDQINGIAEKIATLNKQINTVEMSGSGLKANELRDQRDLLIDELSLLTDVSVEEYDIKDPSDPTRVTGATNYIVHIAGGQTLTNGSDYNKLICVARKDYEKVNQTDINGLYDVKWSNGNDFGLNSSAMNGKLEGLVQLRDGNNGHYFNGTVEKVDTTNFEVTISVTDADLKDMKLCGLSDTGGKITIGGQIYYYSDWRYDETTQEYTFTMDNAKCDLLITPDKTGRDAQIGEPVRYQGIPYYMSQMNAWLRGFAEKSNEIFTSGYDINDDPGCMLFSGKKADGTEYTSADLNGLLGNGLYEITAGNVSVLEELLSDAERLGSRGSLDTGVEECESIEDMISLLTSKEKFNFRNGSASDFLKMILGDITLNTENSITFCDTYLGLATAIDNQRASISGVDEDEEAVNLVKYENAYTLASKMIQTFTEIYDQLILRTGV